ncbi:unnamed protein product [Soboliphyme baturini]|uniref:tRNA N(3)-methylcytidine methyltransferase n=1 Tax=Soboliphyme baturini TaxID=241478 RepID=A0A183IBV2_9BILA|nr:unnamed protein product [Soboliphyme baturini]
MEKPTSTRKSVDDSDDLAAIRKSIMEFNQRKLELEVQKNWDRFYKRNKTAFFKDRHWTKREFVQICPDISWEVMHRYLLVCVLMLSIFRFIDMFTSLAILECGCGVGNLIFPMLDYFPKIFVYACDFSSNAIEYVKNNGSFDPKRCATFVCDLVESDLLRYLEKDSIDIVTMVYMLSAVNPKKMISVLKNIAKVIKPGGSVIFRDYAIGDYAMHRFGSDRKLSDQFYVRQDGTYAYYFSEGIIYKRADCICLCLLLENLVELFRQCCFEAKSCYYVRRETVNRKINLVVPRTFIQGRFIKS